MIIQKAVKRAIEVFEQKMTGFANNTDTKELTADLALEFSLILKEAFSEAGQRAYQTFIESYDLQEPTMEINRQKLRWKMRSRKKFLTPFGTIEINRSLYQSDVGGPVYCPLDDFWGMKAEFATEEVRQAVAFSMAHLTAEETEQMFEKCAWFHPSATAIKNITDHIGDFVEAYSDAIIPAIQQSEQIPPETDILVASMDGARLLWPKTRPVQESSGETGSGENFFPAK